MSAEDIYRNLLLCIRTCVYTSQRQRDRNTETNSQKYCQKIYLHNLYWREEEKKQQNNNNSNSAMYTSQKTGMLKWRKEKETNTFCISFDFYCYFFLSLPNNFEKNNVSEYIGSVLCSKSLCHSLFDFSLLKSCVIFIYFFPKFNIIFRFEFMHF